MSAICVIGTALPLRDGIARSLRKRQLRALRGRAAQQRLRSACRARARRSPTSPDTELLRNAARSCDEKPSTPRLVLVDRRGGSPWSARPSRTARWRPRARRARRSATCCAIARTRRDVFARHAKLHRKADRRAVLEPRHAAAQRREVVVEERAPAASRNRSRSALLFATSTNCAKFELLQLLVERQVEARAARADVGDVALDARSSASRIASSFFASRERRRERAALGQPQVDDQLGPRRRREELLRHEAEQRRAPPTNTASVAPITIEAMRDAPVDQRAEAAIERRVGRRASAVAGSRRGARRRAPAAASARAEPRAQRRAAQRFVKSGSIR